VTKTARHLSNIFFTNRPFCYEERKEVEGSSSKFGLRQVPKSKKSLWSRHVFLRMWARFKKEIRPMDWTSQAILALKPVSFKYNSNSKGTLRFGLIAEEVAKVNSDWVAHDRKEEIYSVRYEAVNAIFLNKFLKEHKKVEDLEGIVASLVATVKEQASQIQKVSAQLEASKPASQTVNNNQ
jgi:Chaperone of endosialidase